MTGNKLWTVLALFFVAVSAFLGYKYFTLEKEYSALLAEHEAKVFNEKILQFQDMFVNRILRAEGEVSFDDRLRLENAVRDLDDEELLDGWNTFVNSKTEAEAQDAVKELLAIFVRKLKSSPAQ